MGLDISVVICTHNRYDILVDAIASIEAQSLPRDSYELVLVDNSTDLASLKEFHRELEIECRHKVVVEATPGLSRARNVGVRAAEGRIVAFIDDDARAEPNWAEELVGAFSRIASARRRRGGRSGRSGRCRGRPGCIAGSKVFSP